MTNKLNLSIVLATVCSLSACNGPKTEPAAPAPTATVASPGVGEPGYSQPDAEDGPMECLAYIELLRAAIRDGRATGDDAALKVASDSMRTEAGKGRTEGEFSQYYASSVAVFDDLPAAELQRKAGACVANPPSQSGEE